jgi:hypothetical protein
MTNGAQVDRRRLLGSGVLALSSGMLLAACVMQEDEAERGALGGTLPVLHLPRELLEYPLPDEYRETASELEQVAVALLPPTMPAYPLALVLHAIRLWGVEARFRTRRFSFSSWRGRWGRCMFQCLTDERAFHRWCNTRVPWLFVANEYGLKVRTASDVGFGYDWLSTHPGKYLQVMGELGTSSEQPIQLADAGQQIWFLRDVVEDDARNVHLGVHPEFILNGLIRYLGISTWENKFRQRMSFDRIVHRLTEVPMGQGVCFGSHVPMALAIIRAIHETYGVLTDTAARLCEVRIRNITKQLIVSQKSDGEWTWQWGNQQSARGFSWGTDILDNLCVTGHMLEWMSLVPETLRPEPGVMARACRFVCRALGVVHAALASDWHNYLPASHAARAVMLLNDPQRSIMRAVSQAD